MTEEGIRFLTGIHIGKDKDITVDQLMIEYDAVLICTGSTVPRDLQIEGRGSAGIHFAMDYLKTTQRKQCGDDVDHVSMSAQGLDVIVIGGGDTGCDCIGTALRQGAKSITTFEILPQPPNNRASDNPWPQFPKVFKVDYGHEEVNVKWGGDPRRYNTVSTQFLHDSGGRVSGVKTKLVEWNRDPKGSGWKMSDVPESDKEYRCQMVLLSMGFLGPETFSEVDHDDRGNIRTPKGSYATNIKGLFTAGDCHRGQSLVVWAITEGRQAAREIDQYLKNGASSTLPTIGGLIQG